MLNLWPYDDFIRSYTQSRFRSLFSFFWRFFSELGFLSSLIFFESCMVFVPVHSYHLNHLWFMLHFTDICLNHLWFLFWCIDIIWVTYDLCSSSSISFKSHMVSVSVHWYTLNHIWFLYFSYSYYLNYICFLFQLIDIFKSYMVSVIVYIDIFYIIYSFLYSSYSYLFEPLIVSVPVHWCYLNHVWLMIQFIDIVTFESCMVSIPAHWYYLDHVWLSFQLIHIIPFESCRVSVPAIDIIWIMYYFCSFMLILFESWIMHTWEQVLFQFTLILFESYVVSALSC